MMDKKLTSADKLEENSSTATLSLNVKSGTSSDTHKIAGRKSTNTCSVDDISTVVTLIKDCDFVALDLEFSGLFAKKPSLKSIESYYHSCRAAASQFSVVQLGVCTAKQSQDNWRDWEVTPFSFFVLSNHYKIVSFEVPVLRWMTKVDFPFTEWITHGLEFERLSSMQHFEEGGGAFHIQLSKPEKDRMNRLKCCGLQLIIQAIIEEAKPIILHNGFLDMIHIYDKFIGPLPLNFSEFASEWNKLFIGGTIDTKYVCSQGVHTVFKRPMIERISLLELHNYLLLSMHVTRFRLGKSRETCSYPMRFLSEEDTKRTHEASFDALLTAKSLILELEWFTFPDKLRLFGKRKLINNDNKNKTQNEMSSMLWDANTFLAKWRNYVFLMNISPGFVFLNQLSTPQTSNNNNDLLPS